MGAWSRGLRTGLVRRLGRERGFGRTEGETVLPSSQDRRPLAGEGEVVLDLFQQASETRLLLGEKKAHTIN